MYKEDVVDIMTAVILKSQEEMMKYRGMPEHEIEQNLKWSQPQIDHANELILNELLSHGIIPADTVE